MLGKKIDYQTSPKLDMIINIMKKGWLSSESRTQHDN